MRLDSASLRLWDGMSELAILAPKETGKAIEAYAAYVDLGPNRSLAKLADDWLNRGIITNRSSFLRQLQQWSTDHGWQERIRERALLKADIANEFRADTWVAITGEYHRRVVEDPAMRKTMKLESLHGIYDRVKPDTVSKVAVMGQVQHSIRFVFEETTERD